MEYLAPRAFCVARPHLSPLLSDDPSTGLDAASETAARKGVPVAEHLIGTAMGSNATQIQSFARTKGFEGIAWESVGIEALRTFHGGGGTYHRIMEAMDDAEWPSAEVLTKLDRPYYVEIGEPGNRRHQGVSFTPVAAADAQGDELRDHVQIVVWPNACDADWRRPGTVGHLLTIVAEDGEDLRTAIAAGIERAIVAARKVPAYDFWSRCTTTWNDELGDVVRRHAAALSGIVSGEPVEPVLQDGVKPYLLAKLEGPKGDAAMASLMRRGYVMEHRHRR